MLPLLVVLLRMATDQEAETEPVRFRIIRFDYPEWRDTA